MRRTDKRGPTYYPAPPGGGGEYDGDPTVIDQDSTHRFATDTEKSDWNSKAAGSHNHDSSYSALGHNHTGVYEPANANIQTHVAQAHAPSNAQKNSDITISEIEAKLVGKINSHTHGLNNFSVTDQTINAATSALLTGSLITVPSTNLQIGTIFKYRISYSKTNAGTAANTFFLRIGTNGTVADAAILTFTMPVGTAVIDTGQIDVTVTIRGPLSASCIAQGLFRMTHNLSTTGLANVPGVALKVTSAGFNATTANLKVSLSCTTAASTVLTFQQVIVEVINL